MNSLSNMAVQMWFSASWSSMSMSLPGYKEGINRTGKDTINNWVDRKHYLQACQKPRVIH